MATMAVVVYPDEDTAAKAVAELRRLQADYLIDLEDVAYITKDANGKVKVHTGANLTAAGAAGGAFWGFLFGLIFLVPFLGAAIGAASGALAGALTDYGIDQQWLKEVGDSVKPNSSALFVLARNANAERVVPEMAKFGGKIVKTNLTSEQEEKLREALTGHLA